ncbi:MAG: DsrE family protein [Planctomycetaceae bacterium]
MKHSTFIVTTFHLSALTGVLIFTVGWAEELQYHYPRIEGHGKVVQLVDAAHQPRAGSRIVVDLTAGGDPQLLNPGIEKLARYVNIYRGAGAQPADVRIAVVLHGDATLTLLNPEVYAQRFDNAKNPNLELAGKLRAAGVEFFVCGQSLIGKGSQPSEVDESVSVAVSGLTALVNLQSDGYAYVPLAK